jgi:hypothetical protein
MFQSTELLADNPACVHCLVTEHILESLERFNGSLPFVVDLEGAVFIIFCNYSCFVPYRKLKAFVDFEAHWLCLDK